MILLICVVSLFFVQIIVNLMFFYSWKYLLKTDQLPEMILQAADTAKDENVFISVLIPVRNEAANIFNLLNDLLNQTLNKKLFEIIVIDDHSEDNTVEIVDHFRKKSTLNLSLLKMPLGSATKKNAITLGIENAAGEYIVTTDGDCCVGKSWLQSYFDFLYYNEVVLVSGPVSFFREENIFQKLQTIEFASLVATGAASIGYKFGSMCNGANLCFKKLAFYEVNGYKGHEQLASGDDQTLLKKMFDVYPEKIKFLKNKNAVVYTYAQKTIKAFYYQRKRWAGKWRQNKDIKVALLAVLVFCINLNLLLALGLTIKGCLSIKLFLLLFIAKFISELLILSSVMNFLGKQLNILYFFILQLIYPFYVVFFALSSITGRYKWKGRAFKR